MSEIPPYLKRSWNREFDVIKNKNKAFDILYNAGYNDGQQGNDPKDNWDFLYNKVDYLKKSKEYHAAYLLGFQHGHHTCGRASPWAALAGN